MRVLRAPVVTAVLLIVSVPACGLDAGGRLAVGDAGAPETMMAIDDDGAAVVSSDGDVPDEPADDATTPVDAASPVPGDASTTKHPDAGAPPKDAAADAAQPFTCASCAAAMCPTQIAACGKGSQCLAYRDCDVACGINGSSNCGNTCGSMYPTGQSAFAALTLCDIGCGAGCAAGLSFGTP